MFLYLLPLKLSVEQQYISQFCHLLAELLLLKMLGFLVTGGSPGEGHFGVPAGDSAASGLRLTEVCFLLAPSSTTFPSHVSTATAKGFNNRTTSTYRYVVIFSTLNVTFSAYTPVPAVMVSLTFL